MPFMPIAVRSTNRLLATALVALSVAVPAPAGSITKLVRKGKPPNRVEYADFQGKAHLRIPSGFLYLTGDELAGFDKEVECVPDAEEVGILIPETGDWYVRFLVPAEDPLGGVAKEDVAAHTEEILAKLRAKAASANKDRAAAGLTPLRITGWTHKPLFDKAANRVTWGYRLTDDHINSNSDEDALHFESYLFGPNGEVVELQFVGDLKGHSKPLVEYKKIVDTVLFGAAPGAGWFGLTTMADNEKALFIGAGVMAIVVGGGLMFRRSSPDKKRSALPPRSW